MLTLKLKIKWWMCPAMMWSCQRFNQDRMLVLYIRSKSLMWPPINQIDSLCKLTRIRLTSARLLVDGAMQYRYSHSRFLTILKRVYQDRQLIAKTKVRQPRIAWAMTNCLRMVGSIDAIMLMTWPLPRTFSTRCVSWWTLFGGSSLTLRWCL